MTVLRLEHVNLTVRDADQTARFYEEVFNFHRRWDGPAIDGGRTVHVGTDDSYLALHQPPKIDELADRALTHARLNHIGIAVADLDGVEARLAARGVVTHSHENYEPGRRFYFDDPNGVEVEVVSY